MGMFDQVEELVVPALAHVVGPEDHCRVRVWSWLEHQTQSPTLVLNRQLTLWTFTILNWKYSMFCMFIKTLIENQIRLMYH
jgi:hypothetical protein